MPSKKSTTKTDKNTQLKIKPSGYEKSIIDADEDYYKGLKNKFYINVTSTIEIPPIPGKLSKMTPDEIEKYMKELEKCYKELETTSDEIKKKAKHCRDCIVTLREANKKKKK